MNHFRRLATAVALFLSPTLAAATNIQPILQRNQPLPDGSGDRVLDMIYTHLDISRDGDIALRIRSYDPSSPLYPYEQNDFSLLLWTAGSLSTVVRPGDPIGDAGAHVRYVYFSTLSPNGRYLTFNVSATRDKPFYSEDYNTYVWDRTTSPGQFVPLLSNPRDTFVHSTQVNSAGNAIALISYPSSRAILAGPVGQLQSLISTGSPLPYGDTAVDARPIAINAAGQTLFTAATDANSPGSAGVYLGTPGNLQPIALRNDPAPGIPSARFSDIQPPHGLSDAGRTAFAAAAVGPGLRTTNDQGIWLASPTSLHLLAREGDPVPGTAERFTSFSSPSISADGHVAFIADFTTKSPDQASLSDSLWMTDPASADQLARVAAIGDPAPGIPGTFDNIYQFALSDTGLIAFLASVRLADTDPFGFPLSATGLWIGRPGDLHLLLRDGDPLSVDGTTWYTSFFALEANPGSNDLLRLTDDGRLLVDIVYRNIDNTESSEGFFLLSLPEPSPLLPACGLALPLLARRHTKPSSPR